MESDQQFYDSLEEEESPDLLPLRITPASSELSDRSLTVPLYNKEVPRSEIKPQLHIKQKSKSRSKSTLRLPSTKNSSASSISQLFLNSKPKKSYVDLFHAKIGYVQGTESTETTRAICDDDSFKTARSSEESFYSDAETSSFVSDSSFYRKFLENEQRMCDQLRSVSRRSGVSLISKISQANSKSDSMCTDITQHLSVSAITLPNKIKKGLNKQSRVDKTILKVPTLGGLGPDLEATKEKLDRLKKQQKYGQRVSNQNRVKIMEMKVMKNFKYELKKSADLNKCAENVLNT